MYSQAIVEKTLHRISKAGHTFKRRPVDECRSTVAKFAQVADPGGQLARPLTTAEQDFCRSESILCRSDFRYWAERYGFIENDGSVGEGIAPVKFWQSQESALALIAKREEDNFRALEKHGFAPAIQGVWHKTRQQGATGLLRLITMHRLTTRKNTRAIAASLDGEKVHELYTRDLVILDNLPFYLKPSVEFSVKDSHIGLDKLKSRITYQMANQQAGVGTGQQFDVSHMTEVALWIYANRLQFDFLPSVPQSPQTFVGFESTANGRSGFWYEFTESVRRKDPGFENWFYVFTPWWINSAKNRLAPPDGWEPDSVTKEHADLIERTSIDFAGVTVRPNVTQLFWWETERLLNKHLGTLHIFFSNYPATPEQSFQHSGSSALPLETIEWMRTGADYKKSMPYAPTWIQ
jgi:hypothetical protein